MKQQIRDMLFSILIGSYCLSTTLPLIAEECRETKMALNNYEELEADLLDSAWDKADLSSVKLFSTMRSRCHRHHSSSSNSSSIILYQADLTRCGIIDDRAFLGYTGDFALAFGGDDFSCFVLPNGGIQITPRNGSFFTKSTPPLFDPGPVIDAVSDHIKFLTYSIFAEAPINGGKLCTTWVGSGQQLNVASQPFNGLVNGAVIDSNLDPRLACFCFVSIEPTLGLMCDWVCTNGMIYALVGRSPGFEAIFGNYAAYIYLIPVHKRNPKVSPLDDVHTFQTCYNRQQGTVTWKLDGKSVFSVSQLGIRLTEQNAFVYNRKGRRIPLQDPNSFKVLDQSGVDTLLDPIGFQSGLSFYTGLDLYAPRTSLSQPNFPTTNSALTRLEANLFRSVPNAGIIGLFYNYPHLAPGIPAQFVTDAFDVLGPDGVFLPTIPSNYRLWGQGAILRLFDYTISIEE